MEYVRRQKASIRLVTVCLLVLASLLAFGSEAEREVFTGCDRHMATTFGESCSSWTIRIVEQDGRYLMDGQPMEELRHANMPSDGLSLAMIDRVGRPNMYYLVLPRQLDIYINCEFGACTFRRAIIGECCTSP